MESVLLCTPLLPTGSNRSTIAQTDPALRGCPLLGQVPPVPGKAPPTKEKPLSSGPAVRLVALLAPSFRKYRVAFTGMPAEPKLNSATGVQDSHSAMTKAAGPAALADTLKL